MCLWVFIRMEVKMKREGKERKVIGKKERETEAFKEAVCV